MPVEQPAALHENLGRYLRSLSAWQLSAFCVLASIYSSLVLALAVIEKHIDAKKAYQLSRLEEEAQAEQWGRDGDHQLHAFLVGLGAAPDRAFIPVHALPQKLSY